ncbi:MAG: V-type ATPase 116kDa subunit family protein [Desulfobacterales bacterium]|jgi:V/A-type H+-transporting ATPase subunit I|nr:V-type ATPase 116kDa subunit family protein [Desulfobacterales bacterium]
MFKSEKLVRITIQVPEPFISVATGILARFKLLHLIRIDQTHLGRLGYIAESDDRLIEAYEQILAETHVILDSMGIRGDDSAFTEQIIPEKEIFRIKERFGEIQDQIGSVLKDYSAVEQAHGQVTSMLEKVELLPEDLDLARLSQCVFVNWEIGLISSQGLDKLEESLSRVHHAVVELACIPEWTVLLVFGLKPDWPTFERALKGALFEPVRFMPDASGTVSEMISGLRSHLAELADQRQKLFDQRSGLQRRFEQDLSLLHRKAVSARQILSARRLFGKVDHSYLISGWIPDRLFPALRDELARATEGKALIEKVDPENLREVREGIVNIPILFNNPLLISPFEKLTSLYGTPRYQEVEPTVFFALSFLLLFGMMFGDVGQGAVLFLSGYLIFRRLYRYLDYGIILMECGFFSIVFGFLYGSIFGMETLIPALWFRPMENITYFVKVTLILGAGLLSLGMVLNFINALRLKEYEKLLSAGGLAGALLYWMAAGLGMKYMLTGRIMPGELTMLGWVAAVLMGIMVLHRPIYRFIVKGDSPGRIIRQAGFLTEIMESVIELFDDLMRLVANTVSFIRIAAFALSHAALFIAVFSIADILSHEKSTSFSYWIVVGIGNIVIILLEGLVVSIQTVRLEYYEFYGKFFRGGGERFKPFGETTNGSETKKS